MSEHTMSEPGCRGVPSLGRVKWLRPRERSTLQQQCGLRPNRDFFWTRLTSFLNLCGLLLLLHLSLSLSLSLSLALALSFSLLHPSLCSALSLTNERTNWTRCRTLYPTMGFVPRKRLMAEQALLSARDGGDGDGGAGGGFFGDCVSPSPFALGERRMGSVRPEKEKNEKMQERQGALLCFSKINHDQIKDGTYRHKVVVSKTAYNTLDVLL